MKAQFRELDADKFAAARKMLIQEKGSEQQKNFLKAARENSSFENWFNLHVPYSSNGTKELPLYPEQLAEDEFKNTTPHIEKSAFDTWHDLTPQQASRASFWGAVTLNHLKHNIIDTSNLASGKSANQSGLERIEHALKQNNKKMIDDTVRTILRRLSGLPEARGELRTVYVNCAFGRAWWREKTKREIIALTGGDADRICNLLRTSQDYWEKLVMALVAPDTIRYDKKISASFIWALSDYVHDPNYAELFKSKGHIDECLKMLEQYSDCEEFSILDTRELKDFMQLKIIKAVMNVEMNNANALKKRNILGFLFLKCWPFAHKR